jgi:hypothetical protein
VCVVYLQVGPAFHSSWVSCVGYCQGQVRVWFKFSVFGSSFQFLGSSFQLVVISFGCFKSRFWFIQSSFGAFQDGSLCSD